MSFVLASDRQNDGDVLAMNGASAALVLSPLPFHGPIASVRLGYIDGQFVPFPTHDALENSDLDLIVSGTREAVLMIEGFAREMPEELMASAITTAHDYVRQICDLQEELAQKVGAVKAEYEIPEPDRLIETLQPAISRNSSRRSGRKGSSPGPRPAGAEAAGRRRGHPRPRRRRRHDPGTVLRPRGMNWKAASSAT